MTNFRKERRIRVGTNAPDNYKTVKFMFLKHSSGLPQAFTLTEGRLTAAEQIHTALVQV